MPQSHPCLFSHSQEAWFKGKGVVSCNCNRGSLKKWNPMSCNWNDVSSRNVTMLTFHSVTPYKRRPQTQATSVYWERDPGKQSITPDSLAMLNILGLLFLCDLTKQQCDLTPVVFYWPESKSSGQCWPSLPRAFLQAYHTELHPIDEVRRCPASPNFHAFAHAALSHKSLPPYKYGRSIDRSIYPSIHPSIHPFIYLSVKPPFTLHN